MKLNAKIVGKQEFSQGNFILRISPEDFKVPNFTAGQYCVVGLPPTAKRSELSATEESPSQKPIKRAYSIASTSLEKNYIELYITMVKSGSLTPRLYNLNLGDEIWIGPRIVGHFTLDKISKEKNLILIATGTGLAPYMSMIRTIIKEKKLNRHITIIHGARNSWELGYQAELETLSHSSELFHYIPVISRPEDEHNNWEGDIGHINDLWLEKSIQKKIPFVVNKNNSEIFLCGNPLMIEAMVELLGKEGMVEDKKGQTGTVHLERYW